MKQSHKALLMWVLLILMFVAIWNWFSDVPKMQSTAFSSFITDVRNNHVKEVRIKDHEYRYKLDTDGTDHVTIGVNSEEVNKLLFNPPADHPITVTVEKEESSPLWASALVT